MIVVRNITDKMHEDELKELIYSYYDETYGGVLVRFLLKQFVIILQEVKHLQEQI